MKKTPGLLLCLAGLLFLFSGCTKKTESPSFYIRATVNSTECSVNDCIAFTSGSATIIKGAQTSATTAYAYISLSIQKTGLAPGEIKFAKAPGTFANVFYASGTSSIANQGTIEILEVSGNTISGTFSFKCTDGTEVTAGEFTAKRI